MILVKLDVEEELAIQHIINDDLKATQFIALRILFEISFVGGRNGT